MPHNTQTSPGARGNSAESDGFDFAEAESLVAQERRRELVTKITELRRQADNAKERAKTAQQRFERAVALMASERPEREDWYEYPGALPRKVLTQAAGLSTVALHRTMERHRKARKGARR